MDSYGLSKVCNEKTARAFAMRYGADIYALRIGNVIEPHEYGQFRQLLPPIRRCASATPGAISTRATSARSCRLCLEKDGLGFQVFNAVNDTITLDMPTREALKKLCPNTPITREIGEFEAPLSNRKAREVLGFKESARLAEICRIRPTTRRDIAAFSRTPDISQMRSGPSRGRAGWRGSLKRPG